MLHLCCCAFLIYIVVRAAEVLKVSLTVGRSGERGVKVLDSAEEKFSCTSSGFLLRITKPFEMRHIVPLYVFNFAAAHF